MPDLAIQERFVPGVMDGSKPFTLRRAWKNGRTPWLGDRVRFVVKPRTPERRVVGTATVMIRATIAFDENGLTEATGWRYQGLATAEPALRRVVCLAVHGRHRAAIGIPRDDTGFDHRVMNTARHAAAFRFAQLDGFDGWPAFWEFHTHHRARDADPIVRRELLGFGAVVEEFSNG
jgi:hypothetical protein